MIDERANCPAKKVAAIRLWLGEHQRLLNDERMAAGNAEAVLGAVEQGFVNMAAVTESSPEAQETYRKAVIIVSSLHDEITTNKPGMGSRVRVQNLENTVRTVFCATGVTATAMNVTMPSPVTIFGTSASVPHDYLSDANKCGRVDEQLAVAIRQAWECGLGGGADPWRSAMYAMRQAFDHLLETLAPPQQVRASQYWQPKTEGPSEVVHRRERIEYAGHIHVKNESRRNTLLASSRHTLHVYQQLNSAHSRDAIHEEEARLAVNQMHAVIMDWIDSLYVQS
jgi:hypothetical protein